MPARCSRKPITSRFRPRLGILSHRGRFTGHLCAAGVFDDNRDQSRPRGRTGIRSHGHAARPRIYAEHGTADREVQGISGREAGFFRGACARRKVFRVNGHDGRGDRPSGIGFPKRNAGSAYEKSACDKSQAPDAFRSARET